MHTTTVNTPTPTQKARKIIGRYKLQLTESELIDKIKDETGIQYTPDQVSRIAYQVRVRRMVRNISNQYQKV